MSLSVQLRSLVGRVRGGGSHVGELLLRPIDDVCVHGVFRIFGFVARKQGGVSDNSCHLFAELDPEQPASAIVNFVTKVMIGQSKVKS